MRTAHRHQTRPRRDAWATDFSELLHAMTANPGRTKEVGPASRSWLAVVRGKFPAVFFLIFNYNCCGVIVQGSHVESGLQDMPSSNSCSSGTPETMQSRWGGPPGPPPLVAQASSRFAAPARCRCHQAGRVRFTHPKVARGTRPTTTTAQAESLRHQTFSWRRAAGDGFFRESSKSP